MKLTKAGVSNKASFTKKIKEFRQKEFDKRQENQYEQKRGKSNIVKVESILKD